MAEKVRCEQCDRNFPNEDALAMHNSAKHSSPIEEKSSKKTIIIFVIIGLILISGFWFFYNSSGKNINGNIVNDNQASSSETKGEIQKITLGFKNYNYYPKTIKVKEGIPVEITLDNDIRGCFRSFNIKSLGVSQQSSSPSETIKFTPDKKGSFEFACGMRMAYGTIIVE